MKIPEILQQKAAELERYYSVHLPAAAPLAQRCFLNTIETTVQQTQDDCFVITGDIPAMWLRDSAAQINHYVRYAAEDPEVCSLVEGVLRRQARMVLLDPYANAFNETDNGNCVVHDHTDYTHPQVWERKYEVDSLCAPLHLLHLYWKTTGSTRVFDDTVHRMMLCVCDVFAREQHHETSPYFFERDDCCETDTLPCKGRGNPVGYTGMTWSGFRPSDDRCVYGYLIPAELMAVKAMEYAAEMLRAVYADEEGAARCEKLGRQIEEGVRRYGMVDHPRFGRIYAYETDGLENHLLMDDANCPSLLSLPYLGYCDLEDEVYRNTRAFVLSEENPFYFSGKVLRGVGSPHTPPHCVWPIAVTMQALTSRDPAEIRTCLEMLLASDAGTGYMHESIHVDDPERYTRAWFAWANSLFAELLIRVKDSGVLE